VGVLLTPLKWFCIGLMLLLGLIMAAWIVDGLFVFKVWPDGMARLQSVLEQDIARTYLIECAYGDLPHFAEETANFLYSLIFRVTGIHEMGVRFAEGAALSIPDTVVRNVYVGNFAVIQIAMLSTQLIGVRIATLLMMMPMLALVYGVAMVDGLVQRAVRRACGGRESGSIYHRAKHLQVVILTAIVTTFLIWPSSVNPLPILGVAVASTAVLVRIQWSYYKKHL